MPLTAAPELGRSARKRKLILDAASTAFVSHGYDGTSMDDVAAVAAVSKPAVVVFTQACGRQSGSDAR